MFLSDVWTVPVPREAWGPAPVEWFADRRPVWAWVGTRGHGLERMVAWAYGANDRVVFVKWFSRDVVKDIASVVWRPAVTHRARSAAPSRGVRREAGSTS